MRTGVFMESLTGQLVLLLLTSLCLAAPGLPGTQRKDTDAWPPSAALPNPFGTTEEDHRLLKSYIQSSLKDGGPEISTWEQEVFFLLGLYDFDRSGLLDGLEMMKLLSDYQSHHTPGSQVDEQVVSMVDVLLQTQDLNQDGLLAPSELLSPVLPHTQDSSIDDAPHAEQEVVAEEKLSGRAAEPVPRKEAYDEVQPHDEEQAQHEKKPQDEEAVNESDEHKEQSQGASVHQGQPEI